MKITADQAYNLWNGYAFRQASADALDAKVVYRSALETDSYGETFEGTVIMVLEIDGQTYRLNGVNDSYGEIDWDLRLDPATPTVKTIEVWE